MDGASGGIVTENKTIEIPAAIYDEIALRIEDTGFDSVSDYVAYVLREFLTDDDDEEVVYSKEDEEKVKERLRALGYLD